MVVGTLSNKTYSELFTPLIRILCITITSAYCINSPLPHGCIISRKYLRNMDPVLQKPIFQCNFCRFCSKNPNSMQYHRKLHIQPPVHVRRFRSLISVKEDERRLKQCPKTFPYNCKTCGKGYIKHLKFRSHSRICIKRFANDSEIALISYSIKGPLARDV